MALRFNVNSEYLSRNSGVPSSTTFTIAAWVYIVSDLGAGVAQGLFWLGGSVSTDSIFLLWNDSGSGAMSGGVYKASPFGIDIATPASRPAVGTWAYVVMRRSGTASNTFSVSWAAIGATSFTTGTAALIAGTTPGTLSVDTMRVGTTDSTSDAADARYAGIKVWDAALTDTELLAEMQQYLPVRIANLHLFSPCVHTAAADCLFDFGSSARSWTANGTHSVEDGPPIPWGGSPLRVGPINNVTTPISALATTTPVASLSRAMIWVISALRTTSPVSTVVKSVGKIARATTTPPASMLRAITRALLATTTPVADLAKGRATLTAAQAVTTPPATLTKTFLRPVAALAATSPVAGLVRQTGKILRIATTPPATLVRATGKILRATSTPVTSLVAIKVKLQSALATTTPGRTLTLIKTTGLQLLAATTPVAALQLVTGKILRVTTSPVASLAKGLGKRVSALAQSTPVASMTKARIKAVSALASTTPFRQLMGVLTPFYDTGIFGRAYGATRTSLGRAFGRVRSTLGKSRAVVRGSDGDPPDTTTWTV